MPALGGNTRVKKIYVEPVAMRSDVPDGLIANDLVALAGEAGGMGTGHVHNGIYRVQAGPWEKLTTNTSSRYQFEVGEASTTGGNPLTDGSYVMRCSDVSASKYLINRAPA